MLLPARAYSVTSVSMSLRGDMHSGGHRQGFIACWSGANCPRVLHGSSSRAFVPARSASAKTCTPPEPGCQPVFATQDIRCELMASDVGVSHEPAPCLIRVARRPQTRTLELCSRQSGSHALVRSPEKRRGSQFGLSQRYGLTTESRQVQVKKSMCLTLQARRQGSGAAAPDKCAST